MPCPRLRAGHRHSREMSQGQEEGAQGPCSCAGPPSKVGLAGVRSAGPRLCVCPSVCPWGVLSGHWGVTGQAGRRGSPNLSLAVRAMTTGPPQSQVAVQGPAAPPPTPSLIPEESRELEVGPDDVDTGNGQQLLGLSPMTPLTPAPGPLPSPL